MKQHEAVALALSNLGGVATLGQLYDATLKIKDCNWGTKTPFASIRRIVQTHEKFYRLEAGLWGLTDLKSKLIKIQKPESQHSFYQGLALEVGNLKGFQTYLPPQDKNQPYLGQKLGELATLKQIPSFTYPHLVNTCSHIDVVWFNERQMPTRLLEIENSTDIFNSLRKFVEFQDFFVEFFIVASETRRKEFEEKCKATAYSSIAARVNFMDYERLADYHSNLFKMKIIKEQTGF